MLSLLNGCLGKNQVPFTDEPMEILEIETEDPPSTLRESPGEEEPQQAEITEEENLPERGMRVGDYLLELVLSTEAPYFYKLYISADQGQSWYEDSASITTRPVPYYADEDYFILLIEAQPEDLDSFGYQANKSYLVFQKSDNTIKHLHTRDYEIMSFRVFDGILYSGIHITESPNGSISTMDMETGEITYIYQILPGEEKIRIDAWAPQAQQQDTGEILVWIDEYNQQSYHIAGDLLVPGETMSPEPFYRNPELPLR